MILTENDQITGRCIIIAFCKNRTVLSLIVLKGKQWLLAASTETFGTSNEAGSVS